MIGDEPLSEAEETRRMLDILDAVVNGPAFTDLLTVKMNEAANEISRYLTAQLFEPSPLLRVLKSR